MSKRTITELHTTSSSQEQPFAKASTSGAKRNGDIETTEMGEFEDAWEDEIESDEEVMENKPDDNENDGMLKFLSGTSSLLFIQVKVLM